MDTYADELAYAVTLADRAGAVLRAHYGRLERIEYKSARDVVTEADLRSEAVIVEGIRDRYPGDRILAEETGEHDALKNEAVNAGGRRVWIVDPLDGTINYANGIPVFSVSIALVVDGIPTVGVVLDPVRDETFAATAGGPATLGGREIGVTRTAMRRDLVVAMSDESDVARARAMGLGEGLRARSFGSAALELAYVANGRFDAFIQRRGLSNWDIAAAGLIAERGGAVVTSLDGEQWFDPARPAGSIGIIAASPAHHSALLGSIQRRRGRRSQSSPGD